MTLKDEYRTLDDAWAVIMLYNTPPYRRLFKVACDIKGGSIGRCMGSHYAIYIYITPPVTRLF